MAPVFSYIFGTARILPFALLVVVLVILCSRDLQAGAQQIDEYDIKAVFLFSLTHFVTWPAGTDADASFEIGIYGADPFGAAIDRAVAGEKKSEKPIRIRRFNTISELGTANCRILFISRTAMADWQQIQTIIGYRPILTVSDKTGFTERGGMVNLLKRSKNIKIEVNNSQVNKAGLMMSAKLLELARLVE